MIATKTKTAVTNNNRNWKKFKGYLLKHITDRQLHAL